MGQQGRDLIEHRYIIILKFTVLDAFSLIKKVDVQNSAFQKNLRSVAF